MYKINANGSPHNTYDFNLYRFVTITPTPSGFYQLPIPCSSNKVLIYVSQLIKVLYS